MSQFSWVADEADVVSVRGAAVVAMISLAKYAGIAPPGADRSEATALPAARVPRTATARSFLFNILELLQI